MIYHGYYNPSSNISGIKPSQDIRNKDMDEYGFSDYEFFNLDHTFDLLIYPRLCYFREYCPQGAPRWNDTRAMG